MRGKKRQGKKHHNFTTRSPFIFIIPFLPKRESHTEPISPSQKKNKQVFLSTHLFPAQLFPDALIKHSLSDDVIRYIQGQGISSANLEHLHTLTRTERGGRGEKYRFFQSPSRLVFDFTFTLPQKWGRKSEKTKIKTK